MESLQGKKNPAILGSEQTKPHNSVPLTKQQRKKRKEKQSCLLGLFAMGKQQGLSSAVSWGASLKPLSSYLRVRSWKQLAWLSCLWKQTTTSWPITSPCAYHEDTFLYPHTHFFLSATGRSIFLSWHDTNPLAKHSSSFKKRGVW